MNKYLLIPFLTACCLNGNAQTPDSLFENGRKLDNAITQLSNLVTTSNYNSKVAKAQVQNIESLFDIQKEEFARLRNQIQHVNSTAAIIDSSKQVEVEKLEQAYIQFVKQSYITKIQDNPNKSRNAQVHFKEYVEDKVHSYFKSIQSDSILQEETIDYEQLINQESNLTDSLSTVFSNIKDRINKKTIPILVKKESPPVSNKRRKFDKIKQAIQIDFQSESDAPSSISHFENKQGFHIWPLENAELGLRFGKQLDPESKINFYNNGIDLTSTNNNLAKSVFEGKVIKKIYHSDNDNTIILKHDNNYYTVYSMLKFCQLEEGEFVNESEIIGILNSNSNGIYNLHFELWHKTQVQNPSHWLKNK